MKRAIVLLAGLGLASTVSMSAGGTTVSGQYVEARTAEIFTGGCIMGSEAETMGKQAVLAWKVDRGTAPGAGVACERHDEAHRHDRLRDACADHVRGRRPVDSHRDVERRARR